MIKVLAFLSASERLAPRIFLIKDSLSLKPWRRMGWFCAVANAHDQSKCHSRKGTFHLGFAGLLALIALALGASGCGSDAAHPIASSLVASSTTPGFNGEVTLVPTFSGGTAVIGSSGAGSSDISASALSGSSYPTPPLTASKTYTLTVRSSSGEMATAAVVVTPTNVTISNISPANQTLGPGQVTFAATASGGATNNLTWTATGGIFSGNAWTSPTTPGTYTITATSVDESSVTASTNATVTVPVITTQPVSKNLCQNASTVLSAAANYATAYQWNLNGMAISGAASASLTIASASPAVAGNYTVTVSNAAGSATSNTATVVVGSSLTANPQGLSIFATQTATFSAAASGQAPFTFQWFQIPPGGTAGTAIFGATSAAYTTPAADLSLDGSKYYAEVTDACGTTMTSTAATLSVANGNVPPTIITQPQGQTVAAGGTTSFSAIASGTAPLDYQWFVIPAGQISGSPIAGANSNSYDVPATSTTASNDQDAYYVQVNNSFGQAVSQHATLAVGNGILIQIADQPTTVYVNAGEAATFSVTATSAAPLTYQWYRADPGSSAFNPVDGATSASYTLSPTAPTDTGAVYQVVVSTGGTAPVTSSTAGLFVGALPVIGDLCDGSWSALGTAFPLSGCSFQLTAADFSQDGVIVWPTLIPTGNIQLAFTITVSNPSDPPADGFALVLGDPSLGATPTSTGQPGQGLGAEGIPAFVLGFDTYPNAGDPPVPYLGVGRGEFELWENPWTNVNTNIPALAQLGGSISHDYTVAIVQGQMTVTMDGTQVFSGNVKVPPVAYLYFTASTGGAFEQTVISNLSVNISAPSN